MEPAKHRSSLMFETLRFRNDVISGFDDNGAPLHYDISSLIARIIAQLHLVKSNCFKKMSLLQIYVFVSLRVRILRTSIYYFDEL